MVKNKVVPEEMESISYFWNCPKCGRTIKGKTPNEVSFNGGLHLDAHKSKEKKK